MKNQSNAALQFLDNLSNLKVVEKYNNGDFINKYIFEDKITKENYEVKIIPNITNEKENSSTILICQVKENVNQSPSYSSDIDKLNNQTEIKEMYINSNDDNNTFKLYKGHEFEGIFNYLNKNGLANFNGSICISSSGDDRNHAFNLITRNFNDHFYPYPNENSYVKFDFKNHKVSLTDYSLRSYNIFFNKLINWEIEGSNDGINWDKIDERHITEWYCNDYIATYSVNNHNFYQYVQIRLRGPASNNDYLLCLTSIEFFGEYR